MENQTRFDLNTALESWRVELAAQPGLSTENRRELETHLRDTFAELKARGLSEEESFWLARRRVGHPKKLNNEFIKNRPIRMRFINRALMILSATTLLLWIALHTNVINLIRTGNWDSYVRHIVNEYFWLCLILTVLFSLLTFRRRFIAMAAVLFFMLNFFQALAYTYQFKFWLRQGPPGAIMTDRSGAIVHTDWIHVFWESFRSFSFISDPMWFLLIVMLIASLVSTRRQKISTPEFT
jgi:hypothetical protein